MIQSDLSLAKHIVSENDWQAALVKAEKAFEQVQKKTGAGSEWLGWRELLKTPNDAELEQLNSLAETIRAEADVFIVCGIGGSYLGAKAIIEALAPHFHSKGPEILYAGHHMSGRYLEQLIQYLKTKKADGSPKNIYLNVISKSGSTLETALAFRMLRQTLIDLYGEPAATGRIICTTSKEGGVLNKLIAENKYRKFVIPDNTGGRFSVLTPVGLLPIAVAGIDIRSLLYGAVSAYNQYEADARPVIEYAALRYALHQTGFTVDIFATFEPELSAFGGWIQQLLGESEGKNGKGIYPGVATFSTDLHSLGQFIQQGKRSLIETFITVQKPFSSLKVNSMEGDGDNLNYLAGKTFFEINLKARAGTIEAHKQGGVPVINISMSALNEENLGQLIYFFELLTAVYVYCLGENPFDQPGVEDYKKAMYRLLNQE